MQLHRPDVLEHLSARGASLLVVSFAPLERLRDWLPYFRETFRLGEGSLSRTRFLSDPDRKAYRAYGLGRHSILQAYGPKIVWQYLRWASQGKPIGRSGQDTLQRGGDFVVGTDGRLKLSHAGRDQSDRPAISLILEALRI